MSARGGPGHAFPVRQFALVLPSAATIAVLAASGPAGAAALGQALPAFALVAGLLVLGAVADADAVFQAAGARLGEVGGSPALLLLAALGLVAAVTAVLNLDTAVVFLTPVLVAAAVRRGLPVDPFLYGTVVVANGASLLLPGANLTNLMVTGPARLTAGRYVGVMAPAALAALAATLLWLLVHFRGQLRRSGQPRGAARAGAPRAGRLGLAACGAAGVLVVALAHPAPAIVALAVLAAVVAVARGTMSPGAAARAADAPVLAALLALSVVLGVLARSWEAPAHLVAHAGTLETGVIAAGASVALNNLPATVLLTTGSIPHPGALLIGLGLGPNLFATGSLAFYLWWRTARRTGHTPRLGGLMRAALPAGVAGLGVALAVLALTT